MKKIPDYIILKYDQEPQIMACNKCGGYRKVHLPAAVDDFIKQAEAFAESHKWCTKEEHGR